ncbi:MAG: hypothetical protein R3E95_14095 [Thiolinea sp.]
MPKALRALKVLPEPKVLLALKARLAVLWPQCCNRVTTWEPLMAAKSVKLTDWTDANDSNVTLWKSFDGKGDIQYSGFQKQADGSWAATSGREWDFNTGSWKPVTDQNGDGFVLKVGTQNADGSFSFVADTSTSQVLTGTLGGQPADPFAQYQGGQSVSSGMFNTGTFNWDGGSTANLVTDKGTLYFTNVTTTADGHVYLGAGSGDFDGWWGNLVDSNFNGRVGVIRPDGSFSIELAKGKVIDGNF